MSAAVDRLLAIEEIRQVVVRYCRGIDRIDLDTMRSAFHPDAVDDHGTFVGNAWEFCDRVIVSHGRFERTMHCILNHAIEFDGPALARGEVYVVAYLVRATEDGRWVDTFGGRYLDRYECRDGRWAIAHRICVHEWTRSDPIRELMPLNAAMYAQGDDDRRTGALVGPDAFPGRIAQ